VKAISGEGIRKIGGHSANCPGFVEGLDQRLSSKGSFPDRRQGGPVQPRPPSSDPAKWNARSMGSGLDLGRDRDQSLFGTMFIPADENAYVQRTGEAYFCTIFEKPVKSKRRLLSLNQERKEKPFEGYFRNCLFSESPGIDA
jgi:hypothetical protein